MNLAVPVRSPFDWNDALRDARKLVDMSAEAIFKFGWNKIARRTCDGYKLHFVRYLDSLRRRRLPRIPRFVRTAVQGILSGIHFKVEDIPKKDRGYPKVTHDKINSRHTRHFYHP